TYLDGNLSTVTSERVRPTKWAAAALLARAYLFTGDWENAQQQSSMVINNSSLFSLTDLNSAFQKNNNESIWQLQPVNADWNTEEAKLFVLTGSPNILQPAYLSKSIMN